MFGVLMNLGCTKDGASTCLAIALLIFILSLMFAPGVQAMPVTVQITPSSQAIPQGTVASYTVGLSGAPSDTDGYDLTFSGLVPGATYSLTPPRVATPAGSGSTGLTLDASSTPLYCPGTYSFTVTATNSTTRDSGAGTGSLTVFQVGPQLGITITTDKSTYRIGDTVTIQMSANRPAEARLMISPPTGSTSVFSYIFSGPSYALNKTLTVNAIGRYALALAGDDFCKGSSSATANFDVVPAVQIMTTTTWTTINVQSLATSTMVTTSERTVTSNYYSVSITQISQPTTQQTTIATTLSSTSTYSQVSAVVYLLQTYSTLTLVELQDPWTETGLAAVVAVSLGILVGPRIVRFRRIACKYCGTMNPASAKSFCVACGRPLK
jgi:hypothetical protein